LFGGKFEKRAYSLRKRREKKEVFPRKVVSPPEELPRRGVL